MLGLGLVGEFDETVGGVAAGVGVCGHVDVVAVLTRGGLGLGDGVSFGNWGEMEWKCFLLGGGLGGIHLVVVTGEEVLDVFCLGHVGEVSNVEASTLGDGLEGAGIVFAADFGFITGCGWRCFCHGIVLVMLGLLVLEIRSVGIRRGLSLGSTPVAGDLGSSGHLGGVRLNSTEVDGVDDVFMEFTSLIFRRIRPIMPESLNFGFSVHSMR